MSAFTSGDAVLGLLLAFGVMYILFKITRTDD